MRALICAAVLSLTLPAAAAETAGGAKAPVVKAAPAKAPGTPAAAPKQAPAPTTVPVAPDTFDATKEESGKEEGAHNGSSLKIPRFVSLRTDPINLRTGPGVRYPVDWVYVRRRLPDNIRVGKTWDMKWIAFIYYFPVTNHKIFRMSVPKTLLPLLNKKII